MLYEVITIGIPGILFAILYVIYSQYMSRRGGDNINHDAHLLGAVFGFVYVITSYSIHYTKLYDSQLALVCNRARCGSALGFVVVFSYNFV